MNDERQHVNELLLCRESSYLAEQCHLQVNAAAQHSSQVGGARTEVAKTLIPRELMIFISH